jgi:hypothetical protein
MTLGVIQLQINYCTGSSCSGLAWECRKLGLTKLGLVLWGDRKCIRHDEVGVWMVQVHFGFLQGSAC